ncbi:putative methionine synthase [Paratrimastix pyriformis]|uniref:Methionine synthase n=1 Tax=Paratrimastix pyriformis TaxID=342808 RepID=A0ABQ8UIL8_9EUKA|nr:putative methionine synthase [Paratrimastix pyriformis]
MFLCNGGKGVAELAASLRGPQAPEVPAGDRAALLATKGGEYQALLAQMVAGRVAEAMAEWTHRWMCAHLLGMVRAATPPPAHLWLTSSPRLSPRQPKVSGVRSSPGYPSLPDHNLKCDIFGLLGAPSKHGPLAGVSLVPETLMQVPTQSVSAIVLPHPEAAHFTVERIGQDQLADYAARRGWDIATATKWLSTLVQ